jgi:serine/threonine-protein kinase
MQHLQPNTTLQSGKYRIEQVLGQGGFGNTYVGVNTVFNERVAIKEFFMQGINNRDEATGSITISIERNKQQFQEQLEKFKKEALRIRKLDNSHIVKVHDLFEENGTAYYVMDYVDGENLAERLKRTGKPMTEQEVQGILPQILDALKSVHDAGIWHLDLKPANIMADKAGNVKLIDFGASKQLNAQKGGATTSTAISYTNGYAPREQMEQNYDKFGPWTDIYALGATLYALLTNKRPPLPTDIDDDSNEDKQNSLPLPESISGDMKTLILWMMQTNRNLRPQDVDSVLSQMTMDNQPTKEEDIDECTIIDGGIEKGSKKQSPFSLKIRKNRRLMYYIGFSLAFTILVCIVLLYYAKDSLSPQYRIISKKDKTCELVMENLPINQTERYRNIACLPESISGDYVIPAQIDGYNVIKLGDYSFNRTKIKSVVVPQGVKSLGKGAFRFCDSLVSVYLPEGVESIGPDCFYDAKRLPVIELPRTITSIGNNAFLACESLRAINLPPNLKIIKERAFEGCYILQSVVIPNGVEEIQNSAFKDCRSLSNIELPSTIKYIGEYAFYGCKSLKTIIIPEGVSTFNCSAFQGCSSLSYIKIPSTIKTIEAGSSLGMPSIKTIVSEITNPLSLVFKDFGGKVVERSLPRDDVFYVPLFDYGEDRLLYVPRGTKGLYIKAGWSNYFSKIIER